jgi:hypothetical protein
MTSDSIELHTYTGGRGRLEIDRIKGIKGLVINGESSA